MQWLLIALLNMVCNYAMLSGCWPGFPSGLDLLLLLGFSHGGESAALVFPCGG